VVRAIVTSVLVMALCAKVGAQKVVARPDELIGSLVRGSDGYIRNRSSAVARATAWVAAVMSHQPGVPDAAAEEIAAWSPSAVVDIEVEVVALESLIGNSRLNVFFLPRSTSDVAFRRQVFYSAEELKVLRDLATFVQLHGGARTLLGRGAVLHTDIAFGVVRSALTPAAPSNPNRALGARRATVEFADGRQRDMWGAADHLRLARLLLDQLLKDRLAALKVGPSREVERPTEPVEAVRAWYQATVAFTQHSERWDPAHGEQALHRFPDDPELLFLEGCLRESIGAPRIQAFLERAELPPGLVLDYGSPKEEHRAALGFFKQSLDLRPDHAETRLHYSRMLLLDGRPADAVREVTEAARGLEGKPLHYYANLFLGAALEDLGRVDEARRAYERAAALFPSAQSPRIAVSALAMRAGDRDAASGALDTLFGSRDQEHDRDDPWWTYHTFHARDADARLDDARDRLTNPSAAP
jgi:tetratricopeptide (TPR) repeat protein